MTAYALTTSIQKSSRCRHEGSELGQNYFTNRSDPFVLPIDANANRTTTVFDASGRAVATVNALGYRVTQVFDAAGRRTSLVDSRANRYTFVWDAASRQIRQVDPLLRATTFGFDAASEQVMRIDARGNRTTSIFDSGSRLIGRRYPDGSRVTMAYDAVGNRTLLADNTGRYTTLYDALDRARATTNPANLTISYSFDAAGRRTVMIEPSGGRFTYAFSPNNLNTLLINPQGGRTTWQYDHDSRIVLQQLANGIRASYAYDDVSRLIRLAHLRSDGATVTSCIDAWDHADNRISRVEQDGTCITWSYDRTYQLTRERRNGAHLYDITYAYDPAGNRLQKSDSAALTTSSYDAANQLRFSIDGGGTTTFAYDPTGNLLGRYDPSGLITTYSWDHENRLVRAALPNGTVNTFLFNADGTRVARQDALGITNQVWDDQKLVAEADENNNVVSVYTQSEGEYGDLVSAHTPSGSLYSLFEPLGSTSRLADGAENIVTSYVYTAFGDSVAGTSNDTPFTYIGRLGYYHDTGIAAYHVRAREYSPATGRWMSEDPLGVDESDPNLYRYASNGPSSYTDPSGLLLFYGNYCGPATVLVPPPKAIDGLDNCCKVHDFCYKTCKATATQALPFCGTKCSKGCDAAFCKCAKAFKCSTIKGFWRRQYCFIYRSEIRGYFC